MSYVVIRFYRKDEYAPKRGGVKPGGIVRRNLTLDEAREHCQSNTTRGGAVCSTHGLLNMKPGMPGLDYTDPKFCPQCGEETVPAWFDGYTATANVK